MFPTVNQNIFNDNDFSEKFLSHAITFYKHAIAVFICKKFVIHKKIKPTFRIF